MKKKRKLIKERLLAIVFLIVFVGTLFANIIAIAESLPLEIDSIKITDKSDDVTGDILGSSKDEATNNITFHKLYGFVKYDISIKSNMDKDVTILSITDDNNNEYIAYEYDKHENYNLKANGSFDLAVKAVYKNELNDLSKREQSSKITFKIKYLDDTEEKEKEIVINPKTGDRISIYFVLLVVSGIGFVTCILMDKDRDKKKISKISMLIISGLVLTPVIVRATLYSFNILLKSDIELLDKMIVTVVINGKEKEIINNYGDIISGLETPTETGYTFDKWVYEDGSDFDPSKPITEDIKLVARLVADEYTISYDLNGGNVDTNNPTTYKITDKIELVEPTKEHYVFIGWTGTDLAEPTKNLVIENKTGNRTYVANYSPKEYSITYEGLLPEEISSLNNPTNYNIETTSFDLVNPLDRVDSDGDKTEIFVGWKENETISSTITLPNINSMGNKNFEAQWVPAEDTIYTITYNLNGGITETTNLTSFTKKTETFTLVNPTKVGYTFKGWSGTDLTGDENITVKVNKGTRKNLSFEANYTPNQYQVIFNKNGDNVEGTMSNQTFTYDVKGNLTNVSYSREGYTFTSWNTKSDGSGTAYNNQEEVENLVSVYNGTIDLYAQWSPNSYKIRFNANENTAEGSMEDLDMVYDTSRSLTLNNFSVQGYIFDSWNTKADGTGTKIINGAEVNNLATSGVVNLYAIWKPRTDTAYRVEYYQENIDNNEFSLYETDYKTGTTDTDATAIIKTYDHFTYDSTNSQNNISGNINRDGSLVLKVYYKREIHTVSFDSNGGSQINDINKKYGARLLTTELSTPTRALAEFLGWYTDSENGNLINSDIVINEDIVLYAHWLVTPLCRRATTLHTDTCARTTNAGCRKAGYYANGQYGTTTIVYGNTSGETIKSGDAFDCDVNGDGTYNPDNERFYYIKTKDEKAVMVFYSNFEGADGIQTINNYEYEEVLDKFPTVEQWTNVVTEYNGYAARMLKADEIVTACDVQPGSSTLLNKCDYILENTSFRIDNTSIVRTGIWVEIYNNNYYRLQSSNLVFSSVEHTSRNVARPVIDVPLYLIDNSSITTYNVQFDSLGGSFDNSSSDILNVEVNNGGAIRILPTPTKNGSTFEGWYTNTNYTEKIKQPLLINSDKTYYAKWSYTPSHVEFDPTNDAMSTYYSNISTWKNDSSTFQTNMDNNFNSNSCQSCDASASNPYQSCPINSESNKNQCDRPNGFDTGMNADLNVYLSNEATKVKGEQVNYVTVSNGIIYNMIPGETYYWELKDDTSIYGTVKVLGERRIIDAGAVRNVRDLGGLSVDTDGDGTIDGTLKYGKMYRGVRLASSRDVSSLEKLGITEEVDLRGNQSDPKLSNYVPLTITNYEIDRENYLNNYKTLRSALNRVMDDVISGESVYFHCKIGTDRTGTFAYFLEGLLGVSEEDRLQDYELSYFYGLLNRHRFYSYQPGSSITHRFVYMHDLYPTNEDIYNYYMSGSTDATRDADAQRVIDFRNVMINYY